MVNLNCLIEKLNQYLIDNITEKGFIGRSFYGEAFYATALALYDEKKYYNTIKNLIKITNQKNRLDNSTKHWEFNNYALLYLIKKCPMYSEYVEKNLVYGKTKSTNWILLRSLCKLYQNNQGGLEDGKDILRKRQLDSGLILDAVNVSSFQYHCFSATILYEIYEETKDSEVYNRLLKAIEFISEFTLMDGDTLYIGRGQEQIFGYGSLVFLYEIAYRLTEKREYQILQNKVFQYLEKYTMGQSIPLVLRDAEQVSEDTMEINSVEHLGWYSYNNYFDYVPFLLFFLVKTSILKEMNKNIHSDMEENLKPTVFQDENFLRYSTNKYDAILACFPGINSNYQLLPYIVSSNKNITPCFGGETSWGCNLYKDSSIPLPYFEVYNNFSLFFCSKKRLLNNLKRIKHFKLPKRTYYIWENDLVKIEKISKNVFVLQSRNTFIDFSRQIVFEGKKIRVKDELKFKQTKRLKLLSVLNIPGYVFQKICDNKWLIGNNWSVELIDAENVNKKLLSNSYCAKGRLIQLVDSFENIKVQKGQKFYNEYIYSCCEYD